MERFVLAMDQIAFGHGAFLFLHGAFSLRSCWGSETPILGRSNPHAGEIADLRRGEALPMRSEHEVRPVAAHAQPPTIPPTASCTFSCQRSNPEGLGAYDQLGSTWRWPQHVPSIIVGKTGGASEKSAPSNASRALFRPLFTGTREVFQLFSACR